MKLDLLTSLYVFMLAAFIGFEVIRRVSPLLHTPLCMPKRPNVPTKCGSSVGVAAVGFG